MTDEELASLLGCCAIEARMRALFERLDRKISRDGKKRSKLDATLVAIFVDRLRTMDAVIDHQIDDLKHVHGVLREADQPKTISSSARALAAV